MLQHDDWRPRRWRVALVAHETKKAVLTAFVVRHREALRDWDLMATEATGDPLRETTGLRIRSVLAGPTGGDVRIAEEIAAGEVDALVFLRDPLTVKSHEPDPAALLQVADVHNVAVATNLASAECLVRALAPEGALSPRR